MANLEEGGPAFPTRHDGGWDFGGMILRDWFATHAPEMSEAWWTDSSNDGIHWLDARAAWNYAYADAMLAEREKGNG